MDYEKAYKEALERMKSWARGEHPECFSEAKKAAEFIFPELKENEDERIKKEIIENIRQDMELECTLSEENGKRWIAWLEKQGEQKPAWSEEDEEMLESIITCADKDFFIRKEQINWLKSLRPQNKGKHIEFTLINMAQWKDEMVKRKLRDIIEVVENGLERGDPEGVIINELKELLKI